MIAGHEAPDAGKITIDNTVVADSETGVYINPNVAGLGVCIPRLRSLAAYDRVR